MTLAPLSYLRTDLGFPPDTGGFKQLLTSNWDVACAHIDALAVLSTDFNPFSDGMRDDRGHLQQAIDEAIAQNRPLLIMPGTYLIKGPLQIFNAKHLTIAGNNATILFDSLNTDTDFVKTALNIDSSTQDLTLYGIAFQGSTGIHADEKYVNVGLAITVVDGATDIVVRRCRFDHVTPGGCNDSRDTRRVHFIENYCHNCPGPWVPGNFSTVENNDFVCDTLIPSSITGRGHAIYAYGSFENVSIVNNRFLNISEQDIQIRAGESRYQYKNDFLVANNSFENSGQTSIWIGGDESTQIGAVQVLGNRFRNVNGAVFLTGVQGAIVANNHAEYDWQSIQACDSAFVVTAAVGVGHFGCSDGVIVSNNRCIQRNPFFATVEIVSTPNNGDKITVGFFTYTWRPAPGPNQTLAPGEIAIDASLRICALNFYRALMGKDDTGVAPCNVLRYPNDSAVDRSAPQHNTTVVVTSFFLFPISTTAASMKITPPVDNRQTVGLAFDVQSSINALVVGNVCSDMFSNFHFQQNYQLQAYDNLATSDQSDQTGFNCAANVRSIYRGNRFLRKNLTASPHPWSTYTISDGFYVIEDGTVEQQQLQSELGNGRAGVVPIGDMRAYTLLWYGQEAVDFNDGPLGSVATLPYRWNDGDQIEICDSAGMNVFTFTFKRLSPSAANGQFNDPDGLIALINAAGPYHAGYVDFRNDLAAQPLKLMIRISNRAAGTAGNGAQVSVTRFKDPAPPAPHDDSYLFTEQPLTVGQILTNAQAQERYATMQGGCATRVKTYVMSPVVSPERSVWVQGVDEASQSLTPAVYRADILPGVGFTITHAAGTGKEAFLYRVN